MNIWWMSGVSGPAFFWVYYNLTRSLATVGTVAYKLSNIRSRFGRSQLMDRH